MPRRKFPSPEEYGRRLAEAKRRSEKRQHEKARESRDSFAQVLGQLEVQKKALAAVSAQLETLPREVLSPRDMHQALTQLSSHLAAIQLAVENITWEPPDPEWPEGLQETLDNLMQQAKQTAQPPTPPPPAVDPRVPLDPPETIFAGPVTLKVTERDRNGDIETVRVEPTRH